MIDLDMVFKETRLDETHESNWERLNIETYELICSCLTKEQRYTFLQETSTYNLWKMLENKYMKKSNENWFYLFKRLFHLQLKSSMCFSSILVSLIN